MGAACSSSKAPRGGIVIDVKPVRLLWRVQYVPERELRGARRRLALRMVRDLWGSL